MGLLNSILGRGSESEESDDGEPITVGKFYFLDTYPPPDNLREYALIIGPDDESEDWAIYRCNVELEIPSENDPKVVVVDVGDTVMVADEPYQAHVGWITSDAKLDEMEIEGSQVMDLPEQFQDERIPTGGVLDDKEVEQLAFSLTDL